MIGSIISAIAIIAITPHEFFINDRDEDTVLNASLTDAPTNGTKLLIANRIKNLAKKLEKEYGSGFGIRQLERARQFFKMYPIASTLQTQLNWSQYKLLISISDSDKREY